jgi:hypothetical protein
VGPTGQPHPEANRWGALSGRVKEKEKGLGWVLGSKGLGRLDRPNKARLGFAGQLGLWLSRPAQTCGLTG